MVEPLLAVHEAGKVYGGRRPVEALRLATLHVEAGEFVSIVGPSGCGKSTLFNLIAGIEDLSEGYITVGDQVAPSHRMALTAYMFQKDLLFPWRNVLDNAALGIEIDSARSRDEARERARELLPRFGLEGFESHHPSELSGGMRQRVALLRTLLLGRPLILLDEPFASLDALTRRELQTWLRDTWQEGSKAALLVTHDVREAVYLSDRVYVMSPRPGRIVAEVSVLRGIDGSVDASAALRCEEELLDALRHESVPV